MKYDYRFLRLHSASIWLRRLASLSASHSAWTRTMPRAEGMPRGDAVTERQTGGREKTRNSLRGNSAPMFPVAFERSSPATSSFVRFDEGPFPRLIGSRPRGLAATHRNAVSDRGQIPFSHHSASRSSSFPNPHLIHPSSRRFISRFFTARRIRPSPPKECNERRHLWLPGLKWRLVWSAGDC